MCYHKKIFAECPELIDFENINKLFKVSHNIYEILKETCHRLTN